MLVLLATVGAMYLLGIIATCVIMHCKADVKGYLEFLFSGCNPKGVRVIRIVLVLCWPAMAIGTLIRVANPELYVALGDCLIDIVCKLESLVNE